MTEKDLPIIYVFIASRSGVSDMLALAVDQDGDELACHISSSVDWAKHDMGVTTDHKCKHHLYSAKYPNGFKLEWVDDWKSHPFLSAQAEKNRQTPPVKEKATTP